ncbi:hypothetical protein X551_02554 [Methylibium sp. T29]|nr:hypothetical protein X551_02554 [Methylibium sp. T29]EWS58929.1 hypothetical protein Y694_03206 [Methylibium sp. T29-B]
MVARVERQKARLQNRGLRTEVRRATCDWTGQAQQKETSHGRAYQVLRWFGCPQRQHQRRCLRREPGAGAVRRNVGAGCEQAAEDAGQGGRSGRGLRVLRSRPDGLWAVPRVASSWVPLRDCCAVADPAPSRRSDQDRSTRLRTAGRAVAVGGAQVDMGSRRGI